MSGPTVALAERPDLAASLNRLVDAAGGYVRARLLPRLDDAVDAVKSDVAEPDGMLSGAAVGVVRGATKGGNPVWAAARGAWSAAGPKARAAVVVGLVLVLLLAPLVLVAGLVLLIVAAAVAAIRELAGSSG